MQPIRVYTSGINLLAEVDTYQSLQFERSYFGYGKFELHINRYMHEAEAFNKSNIILLNKQGNKAGIIIGKEIALDEAGKETENFKLTGYALDGLVSRRVTVPPEGDSHDRVSGSAEAVMKHYIRRHFVDPADGKRRMPNLVIAPNQNRGPHIHWESRFKNVADELEAIGMRTGVGWGVWLDVVNRQFVFDVIHARDLTQDNAQGYSPVFFSPDFNTIRSQQFVDSDNEYRNFGYVGGQGEGEERKIVTVGEGDVGINRIETFIDARDLGEDEDGDLTNEEIEKLLKERGEQKLREMRRLLSFEAEILTPVQGEAPFEYEKDYDLGDRVDVVNKSWRIIMSAPIVAFNEVHEPGGFRLEATFGEEQPTILTKIKRKFDELTGAEVQEIPSMIAIKEMEQAKRYADHQDLIYDEIAKEDASEKANRAEQNAKDYTLIVADNIEYRTQQFTEQYAQKRISQGYVPPNNPSIGDLWIDITPEPHMWRRWNGAEWEALERTNLDQMLGELQTEQIANGAVVSEKLADLAVTLEKIAENSIDTSKILDDAIDAAKIAAGAVETDALAELSVTDDKIANIHADKITAGRINAERIQIGNGTEFADGYDPTKIEVGGRNYVRGFESGEWQSGANYAIVSNRKATVNGTSGNWNTFYINLPLLEPDEEYTISAKITGDGGRVMPRAGSVNGSNLARLDNSNGKVTSAIFTAPSDGVVAVRLDTSAREGTFVFEDIQVEKGNKPTDWSPAPEDQEAYADSVAQDGKDAKQRVTLWQYEDTTFIDGGSIYANSVTANQIAAGTITANEIASNAITTAKINANAVTTAKINAGAVNADKIATNAVVADKIAANAVTTAKIAAGAVTANEIAAGTISSDLISTAGLDAGVIKFGTMSGERIQAGTITANQLGANSVTASKISANAVTSAKIEAGAVTASKISVNSLSAVSANLGNITAGNITGVNITGATITQTGSSGSIRMDNTGLHSRDSSGTNRISITTSNTHFQGFSPSLIYFEPNTHRFIVGTGAHGLGDGVIGWIENPGWYTTLLLSSPGGKVSVEGDLTLNPSGVNGGIFLGDWDNHIIGVQSLSNARHMTIYPNRASGAFKVRSHHNRSNYRDDMIVETDGGFIIPDIRNHTWSASPNVYCGGSGKLYTASSSRKYKKDIEDLDFEIAENVVENLRPVWYRSAIENEDCGLQGWSYVGLIAEEVAEVEPRLVDYRTTDREGNKLHEPVPQGVQYANLAVYLLPIIKQLRAQMSDVLDEINWFKIENQYLMQKVKQLEGDEE
ncbi:tail fiber domain-containing protein [Halalkalibacterium halodurans]|uniref:Gp37-like protein n=1 Tax=Halalkalibacterium halodurans TaxID=86665 RepID=UPI002E2201FC|nr:tail fiber domain-containing protein [Halalkalibacterium halodurans]